MSLRFQRKERLKSSKTIGRLFKEKQSVGSYPIRFFFLKSTKTEYDFALQSAFSVSKKHFKKAVDRNRIKRLMRESFRLHKEKLILFLNENDIQIAGMWVFVGSEIIDFHQTKTAIIKTIEKLLKVLNEEQSQSIQ